MRRASPANLECYRSTPVLVHDEPVIDLSPAAFRNSVLHVCGLAVSCDSSTKIEVQSEQEEQIQQQKQIRF
jgi:hypothetical protein